MKFAICVIIKDERDYLDEWLTWHFNIGFDAIHLYEDYGSESHKDIIDKYPNAFLHSFEECNHVSGHKQETMMYHFIKKYKGVYDWCAFIDIDEFIEFEEGYNLEKLCGEFGKYNGIMLTQKMYGFNGHIKKPQGMVQENFKKDPHPYFAAWRHCRMKTIVNMNKDNIVVKNAPHRVRGAVFTDFSNNLKWEDCYEKAWYNHYFTKSYEEWCNRFAKRGDVVPGNRKFYEFYYVNGGGIKYGNNVAYMEYEDYMRLGNVLYCAFSTYAYAKENGKTPILDIHFLDYAHELIGIPFVCNMIGNPPQCETEYNFSFKSLQPIPNCEGNIKLKGYMQDANVFWKYIDDIREQMQMSEDIRNKIAETYGDLSDIICVNVRRGDYLVYDDLYHIPSVEWYLETAKKYFPNHKLFINSDDIEWCKTQFGNNVLYAKPNDEVGVLTNFYAQTLCYGNICSNSTFALMGAMLNPNERAVVPKQYWGEKTKDWALCMHAPFMIKE